ncbi:uncharacterized protein LOC115623334 [Scaptodrosophila lebanonensis]|uniref:Uncharacterized protein LOC115623334 n=1 Tax=Drosophila lebanonensis TaxID=7225 RepID=A0A6J2TDJ7_DROLE|nr:uncharacterized protein LOC115623334 [Scaptodrosophila lebanonensis]
MGEIANHEDFHPAPQWLTESYLEPILRKHKQDAGLEITDLIIKPATAKGENYASVMTRVRVEFVRSDTKVSESACYIVKTTYENDPFVANIFAGYNVTNTEMFMYEKVLPKLSEILREIGDNEKIFAETLHVDYEHAAIIFEDLAVLNFQLADRLAGLDFEHTQLALKKLAKMHATAAVLNERRPNMLTRFERGLFNRHTKGFGPIFENLVGVAADFAATCSELGNEYQQKLLDLKKRVVEYATQVYDPQPEHFNTLTHGDFWVNNIMLRYDEQRKPQDMVLIDFQFCSWTSVAVDLHYFLNTSIQNDLRFQQQDALVKYYHEVLVGTLRALKFEGFIPSLRQLVLQVESGRFLAVTSSLVCQAIMINDQNADADFNALVKEDERGRNFRKLLYNNKKLQDNVKRVLPVFNRCGLLDVVD